MAKDQYVILNPTKISGLCGRLVCCLGFEHGYYKEMCHYYPRIGETVETVDGVKGTVVSVNIMDRKVFILVDNEKGQVAVPRNQIKGLPVLDEEEEAEREKRSLESPPEVTFREADSLEAKLQEAEKEASEPKDARGQNQKTASRKRRSGRQGRNQKQGKEAQQRSASSKSDAKGGQQKNEKVKDERSAKGTQNDTNKRSPQEKKGRGKRFYLRRSKGGRNKGNRNNNREG